MAVKLFVGGLSFSTSNERLREAFAAVGSVESASVVTDRDTGRSRGFGFVEMATPEEAEQAISRLNGTNLDGRTILVEKAKSPGSGGGDRRGAVAVRMRGAADLGALWALRRLMRAHAVSLVHTHSSTDSWLGALAARSLRLPVV